MQLFDFRNVDKITVPTNTNFTVDGKIISTSNGSASLIELQIQVNTVANVFFCIFSSLI